MARTVVAARKFLIGGGAIYGVLWLYGMIVPHDGPANFVPVNWPDNWLHFGLAIGMIALGVSLGRRGEQDRRGAVAAPPVGDAEQRVARRPALPIAPLPRRCPTPRDAGTA